MNQLLELPKQAAGAASAAEHFEEGSTTPIDSRGDADDGDDEDGYSVATSEDVGEAEEPAEYTSHVEIRLLESQLGCSADAVEVPYIVEE